MIDITNLNFNSKEEFYENILLFAKGLIGDETDVIANLSNISALLFNTMDNINWAGFYLYKNNQLILGPFQGKPACIRIDIGKGVCGTAAITKIPQVIKNVHEFEGHIACDSASNSEIVIPIIVNGDLKGVLDIDSPIFGRFNNIDLINLSVIVNIIEKQCNW